MRWRNRKEEEPPRKPILVMGICGMPHVADYQHDNYCNTETCNETGWHLNGPELVFMYWMPLEELPKIPRTR